jgi:hypothetical protein
MATSRTQQEMVVTVTVKNTFLDVKRQFEEVPARRSSSVPRTFKPGDCGCGDWPHSDDSTIASDKDVTETCPTTSSDSEQDFRDCCSDSTDVHQGEQDFPDCCSDCTDDCGEFEHTCAEQRCECVLAALLERPVPADEARKGRVTLSLSDTVTDKTKLRSQAKPFTSVRTPPAELLQLIGNAVEVLRSGKDILDVQAHHGGMGGTTMIMATSTSSNPNDPLVLSLVKDALLHSAEQSENTYILGYGAQPFKNLDSVSFSFNVACTPAAHQNTACWDMYETGLCCRATCTWDHPSDMDKMRIIVMVKKRD